MRRLPVDWPGPHRREGEPALRVGAAAAPPEVAVVPALRVGLPDLDHRVRHRLARAVEDAADDARRRRRRGPSAGRRQSPNEKNGPTVCDGVARKRHVSSGVAAGPAEHDVEPVAERPLRLGRVEVERARRAARAPAGRAPTGRSGRTRRADRPGSTSASRAGCVNARPKTREVDVRRAPRVLVVPPRVRAGLHRHEAVAPSSSVRQRPAPVKFGSSGAGCWSPSWR